MCSGVLVRLYTKGVGKKAMFIAIGVAMLIVVGFYFYIAYILQGQKEIQEDQTNIIVPTVVEEEESQFPFKPVDSGSWLPISEWGNCSKLAQNEESAFEIQNAEGLSMLVGCTLQVPKSPFGWQSGPVRFRVVTVPPPIKPDDDFPEPVDSL